MHNRDVFVRSHVDMVQLEQFEPTPVVSVETEPNVEVNITKHTLMICDFIFFDRFRHNYCNINHS